MKRTISFVVSLCLLGMVNGCGKSGGEDAPLPTLEEVKPVLEKTFSDANTEVKGQINNVVGYIQNNDPVGALLHLDQLSNRTDLTREQRQAAAEATIAVNVKLQAAAESGDAQAKEILQRRSLSK